MRRTPRDSVATKKTKGRSASSMPTRMDHARSSQSRREDLQACCECSGQRITEGCLSIEMVHGPQRTRSHAQCPTSSLHGPTCGPRDPLSAAATSSKAGFDRRSLQKLNHEPLSEFFSAATGIPGQALAIFFAITFSSRSEKTNVLSSTRVTSADFLQTPLKSFPGRSDETCRQSDRASHAGRLARYSGLRLWCILHSVRDATMLCLVFTARLRQT